MIITIKGATYTYNIGALDSWFISRSIGSGATYDGVTSVKKGEPFSATVTIREGYEIGSAGITITMGGVDITDRAVLTSDEVIVISIAEVTGNVVITVPTKNIATGEEDEPEIPDAGGNEGIAIDVSARTTSNSHAQSLPSGTTSATNLWNVLTPEAKYYDSTGAYTNYNSVSSIVFPVIPGDKITASSFGTTTESNGTSHVGIRITYLLDETRASTLSADQVSTEYKTNGYVTIPSGVNAVNIPVWDNTKTDHEVYLFPAGATGTPTLPSNANNSGSGSGGNTEPSTPSTPTPDDDGTTWYVNHRSNGSKFTASVNIAGRGWCHVPGTAAYNAYVGKPVNTIGFFTDKASQDVVVGKVTEKGSVDAMTTLATVTATNPKGTAKGFVTIAFPTVTLAQGECLCAFAQDDDDINFYYAGTTSVTDANGISDGNFYGRVPKVYGSGTAWTAYPSQPLCLGWSIGYKAE